MIRSACHILVQLVYVLIMLTIATYFEFSTQWAVCWGAVLWVFFDAVEATFKHFWPKPDTYSTP